MVCTLPDIHDIYVGGTAKPKLIDRMCCHKCEAKGSKWNFKLYQFMRKYGVDNFKIDLLQKYPCKSRKELGKREQHWIDLLKPSLNSQNATSHRKEVSKRYNSKPETKAYQSERYKLIRDSRSEAEREAHLAKLRAQAAEPERKQKKAAYHKRRMKAMSEGEREAHLAKRNAQYAIRQMAKNQASLRA